MSRLVFPAVLCVILAVACGAPSPTPDAGTTNTNSDAGTGCAATRESTAFLGAWNVSGTVTKNGATWPASFPMTVAFASNCSDLVTVDGACSIVWSPVASATEPTLTITALRTCTLGPSTRFTFNGMQVFDGMNDPFPGTTLSVGFDAGTLVQTSSGLSVSGTGYLGANGSSEDMSFSYTATR